MICASPFRRRPNSCMRTLPRIRARPWTRPSAPIERLNAVRERVIEWYRSTLLSRGDDKTATRIVVVMQRVHQNDLVGYLQEQGGFEVLNLPAIATKTDIYHLGGGRTYTR